jgi:drug/metabolite transporter (DMT)-like permease
VSHRAQVWVALWTVYIVWGSTYLGIELAGETIPGVFGAGVRFTLVGLIMFAIVVWRLGRDSLRISRAELASAALVGLLLPGANAVLFVTEQHVPIGLTSLIIASVPLWVLFLRLAVGERPDRVASLGLLVGFVGIVVLVQPGGSSGPFLYLLLTVVAAISWAVGSFLSPRLSVPRNALVATGYETLVGGLVLTVIGVIAGIPLAFAIGRALSSSLYGVQPLDAVTYVLAILGVTVVAFVASAVPASRAASVDPLKALRTE